MGILGRRRASNLAELNTDRIALLRRRPNNSDPAMSR